MTIRNDVMSVSKDHLGGASSPTSQTAPWQPVEQLADFFTVYGPPFAMTFDALFCIAWCPVSLLRAMFPTQPFFSLLGHAPLVLWYARFKKFTYTDAREIEQTMGQRAGALPYQELGIGTLLWRRGFFVPTLYASSEFGVQLGLSYGMPKQPTLPIEIQVTARTFRANLQPGTQQSFLWAHILGASGVLTRVVRALLPLKTWPIAFPSGSSLEPGLSGTDRVYLAHIQVGRLALDVPWLPRTTIFFPLGLYLRNAQLELPETE
jgi:hypothetical protein